MSIHSPLPELRRRVIIMRRQGGLTVRITPVSGGALVSGYLDQRVVSSSLPADTVLVRSAEQYGARMRRSALGRITACDFWDLNSVRVRPSTVLEAADSYFLGLLIEGSGSFAQCGQQLALRPGNIVLYSRAEPFSLKLIGPYHYLVAEISADEIDLGEADIRPALGPVAFDTTPAARMITGILGQIPGQLDRLPPLLLPQLGDTVISLVRTAVLDTIGGLTPRWGAEATFDLALSWIDSHLAEADLSPDRIAAGNHISLSYLHKLFRQHGLTLGAYILARRVDRIRMDLALPAARSLPVAAVGRRWGIPDPSRLSRVFRAHFGMSPREMRETISAAGESMGTG